MTVDFWSELPTIREWAYVFGKLAFKGFSFMAGMLVACWVTVGLVYLSEWLTRRRP